MSQIHKHTQPVMSGQSLIEVLVALGIISIVIMYIASIVTNSLTNAEFADDKITADGYATEGMEIVRSVRNADVIGFKSLNGIYCLDKNMTTFATNQTSCPDPNIDKYIRQVEIEQSPGCGTNIAKIKVKVSWSDAKCSTDNWYCHIEYLESCLSTTTSVNAP